MSAEAQETQRALEEKVLTRFGGLPTPVEEPVTGEVTEDPGQTGLEELDWEGQKLSVPKTLREALLRNDDYTRKTQELAEQRKSLDQMRELTQARQIEASFHESISTESREINVIDAYLQQVKKIDWSSLSLEQMHRQRIEIDNIKERREELEKSIEGKRTKFTSEMQAKIEELRGKSRRLASKSISGFSEETEKAVRSYALSEGLTEREIDNVLLDPRSYRVLYKAMQFDKVKAGTGKAQEAASKVDRVLRPGGASERMSAETAAKLNYAKAMKGATTSNQKAQVIEERLSKGIFARGK